MVTWELTYTAVSEGGKTVNIVGQATDDADPGNPITVRIDKVSIASQLEEDKALDVLHGRYLAKKAHATKITIWLNGKTGNAKTYMEAK